MASYCAYCRSLPLDHLDRRYHDSRYGRFIESDNELFGRLVLEIMQAGLSWSTILKREEGIQQALDNFDVNRISKYQEEDILRLKLDKRIIRNELKIRALVFNAIQIVELQKEFGSFKNWLLHQKEMHTDLDGWLVVFKKRFKFVGKEIVNEFLMSLNLLPGAHAADCYILNID